MSNNRQEAKTVYGLSVRLRNWTGGLSLEVRPSKFCFFQFLFLAVQIRHPFCKRLVIGHEFVFAAQSVDFFMGELFLLAGHGSSLRLKFIGVIGG